MKLPNLENWSSGELSQKCQHLTFNVKNHPNLSEFFYIKNTNLGANFLLLTFFENINFQITLQA